MRSVAGSKIIFDGLAIVPSKLSGIGHATLETIKALDKHPEVIDGSVRVEVFVPFGKLELLERHNFTNVSCRQIILPSKALSFMSRLNLPTPLEFYLGKGLYVFPNYRNFKLVGSPSITYIHDVCFARYPDLVAPKNRRFLQQNIARWLKRTSWVATVSHSSKGEIAKYMHVEESKIIVLPNGVGVTAYKPYSEESIKDVCATYGIAKKYVLFVGNIEPRKNLHRLIVAFQKLPEAMRNHYELVLVGGDGWLNEAIYRTIGEARSRGVRVNMPQTYVADESLPYLIAGASVLAQVSLHEGFGLAVLQALACETPVLASNLPVFKEIAGEVPHYVDPLSTDSISTGLESMLSEPLSRKRLKHGRALAKQYTWLRNADTLVALIKTNF